jgi:hypothetical protein
VTWEVANADTSNMTTAEQICGEMLMLAFARWPTFTKTAADRIRRRAAGPTIRNENNRRRP